MRCSRRDSPPRVNRYSWLIEPPMFLNAHRGPLWTGLADTRILSASSRGARRSDMDQIEPRTPTYLRVVVTTRCPLSCAYCHMEGDPAVPGMAGGLQVGQWMDLLNAGLDNGVRKLK